MSTNTKLIKTDNTFLAKLTFVRLCYHYGKKKKDKKSCKFPEYYVQDCQRIFHFLSPFKNNGFSFLQQH